MEMQPYGAQQDSESWSGKTEQWALIITIVVVGVTSYRLITAEPEILPTSLGELTLSEKVTGAAAQQVINHLHGRTVTPTENSIGFYTGETGDATLYVSVYSTHEDAKTVKGNMAERIRKGNPVFRGYHELQIADQLIVQCRGLDQMHYFFSFGSNLYWLAVDDTLARQAVERLAVHVRGDSRPF